MRRTLILVALVALVATPALANHAWGNYHWAGSGARSLTIGDCVTSQWDPYLNEAISDWNQSAYLSLTKVACGTTAKRCSPATGKIEACNSKYGNNGWLGLAGIWASGDHITRAYTKLNDSYYTAGSQYDTPGWRDLVTCQEIGHDFGLAHQDENFNNPNLGTCMDYTSCPDCSPSNRAPNSHDYQQLATLYNHTDFAAVVEDAPPAMYMIQQQGPGQWGALVSRSRDGHQETYVLDFGNGHKVVTHVTWAEGFENGGRGEFETE